MLTVADISHHQGRVDWDLFGPSVDGVIIKAGGGDGREPPPDLYQDQEFGRNRDEARRRDIPCWFYFFAGCRTQQSPESEADHFVSLVAGARDDEALVLDFEPKVAPADRSDWCVRFVKRVREKTGKTCIFYSNEGRIVNHDWQPVVDTGAPLWAARFGLPEDGNPHGPRPKNGRWPDHIAWQYTQTGTRPGITTKVDLNQFFGDLASFRSFGKPGSAKTTAGVVRDMAFMVENKQGAVLLVTGNSALLVTSAEMHTQHTKAGIPTVKCDDDQFSRYLKMRIDTPAVKQTEV